ncbi:MAG: hypothetical protein ACRDRJ_31555 [Streptosporangiaceae bacterium]
MTVPDPRPVHMPASQAGQLHDLLTIFEHMLAWLDAEAEPGTAARLQAWTARITGGRDLGQLHDQVAAASGHLATVLTGRSCQ